jgi:hypothetical protein
MFITIIFIIQIKIEKISILLGNYSKKGLFKIIIIK